MKTFIMRQLSDFIVCNRLRITFIIVISLIIEDVVEGVHPHDIDGFKDLWGTLGLFFVLTGVGLRSWSTGIIDKGRKLATQGPYSIVRHPLYIGSFLIAIGFCIIISDDENIWVVLIMSFLLYFPKIREEEWKLCKKFGKEWFYYTERVSMFFPKIKPTNIASNWSLSQWVKNREYQAFITSLIALIILELIHELQIL